LPEVPTLAEVAGTKPAKGKPGVADANQTRQEQQTAARLDAVRSYLAENPGAVTEGFTANALIDPMRDHGFPVSTASLAPILQQLRDEGVIRLDRVARGGGNLYKLVNANGARPHGETEK
jgi:Fe2+ or Zn2+ uptake regulation protein